jgi:hypothetical protein
MAMYCGIRGGECSGPAHGPEDTLSCLRGCSGDETNPVIRFLACTFLFWTQVHEQIEGHGRILVCVCSGIDRVSARSLISRCQKKVSLDRSRDDPTWVADYIC